MNKKYVDYVIASGKTKELLTDIRSELSKSASALMNASLTNNQVAIGTSVSTILTMTDYLLAMTGMDTGQSSLINLARIKDDVVKNK